jgi:MoaA/NifB/PqqE/SkfB family radical SAM enzyme
VSLSAPLTVSLAVNSICNLDCKYCYAQPFTNESIDSCEAKRVLDNSHEMGVFQVIFEGGEPLLHREFFWMLEYALQLGFDTNIVTNGTLITPSKAERFKALQKSYGHSPAIQVSLDSPEPTINDSVRGMTTRVKEGIAALLDAGVEISIASVITHANATHLRDIVDTYYPRVRRFHFLGLMPTKKALGNISRLALTASDIKCLVQQEEDFHRMSEIDGDLYFSSLRGEWGDSTDAQDSACVTCNAGFHELIALPNLKVITCDLAPDIIVGNLKKQSLSELWTGPLLRELFSSGKLPCLLQLAKLGYQFPPSDSKMLCK